VLIGLSYTKPLAGPLAFLEEKLVIAWVVMFSVGVDLAKRTPEGGDADGAETGVKRASLQQRVQWPRGDRSDP